MDICCFKKYRVRFHIMLLTCTILLGWVTSEPVCNWYKVGVLGSHVHSIVMSSNNMEGKIPAAIGRLTYLRMVELATMSGGRKYGGVSDGT